NNLPKPNNPNFSSGPCAKRPGWNLQALHDAPFGRSHRAKISKTKIQQVINQSKEILQIPDDYLVGIVPASDTGAFEMAMWTMLGQRAVDVLAWESFSSDWATDIIKQLKIEDHRLMEANYGEIVDFSKVDCDRDVVFVWNGTTSGVKVPNADWISDNRQGLTLCDATSAVFAMDMPWQKLDVVTYSWQKVMGGEAAHGVIVLSPRAVERLESYNPPWPIPKIFRLTKNGKLLDSIFSGATINTPSMLCIEDALDGLNWVKEIGGLPAIIQRSNDNLTAVKNWVDQSNWVDFLASDAETISNTSICLKITDPWFLNLSDDQQTKKVKEITNFLSEENVAYDIDAYRTAPAGLRIWGGGTVETSDIKQLLTWLDYSYEKIKNHAKAA
ncbi:MAG: phosphoserine transaminase, partial [Pseudomonadota bacterium]